MLPNIYATAKPMCFPTALLPTQPALSRNISNAQDVIQQLIRLLFFHPVYDITFNPVICADASYTLPDGTVTNVTGVYVNNFLTTKGCDSIITTNLIVNPTYDLVYNPSICIGESYTYLDGAVTTVTAHNYAYTTALGCDSQILR